MSQNDTVVMAIRNQKSFYYTVLTVTYKTVAMFGYFLVCLQYCITE
jgi:hypothetical protein